MQCVSSLLECIDDTLEIGNLEGCTTNETTVNVRISEKLLCIAWLAATAIEDRGVLCHLVAILLGDSRADVSVDLLGLLRSCCQTCTDSPYRLISEDNL